MRLPAVEGELLTVDHDDFQYIGMFASTWYPRCW